MTVWSATFDDTGALMVVGFAMRVNDLEGFYVVNVIIFMLLTELFL